VSVVAPVLPRAARARRHVAPLLPSASGPVQSTHPEVPLLLLPHAARASWHWSLRPTACRPRRAPTPDPRRAIHQSVPSRAFRSGWFPLSLRPLCRSDGVKPAHRRFAYKRVSPFILARPSVRRAAIAAADAELPLLSPLRVLDHSNTSPRPRRSSNPRLLLRFPPSLAGFRATAMVPPLPRRRCSPETSPPQCRPPATSW
jgi:hypothetical protein